MTPENNEFKISTPTWKEKSQLLDRSYSLSDIQDCFKYIMKNHEAVTDNPSRKIYVNQIQNRIMFRIKTVYYLEL